VHQQHTHASVAVAGWRGASTPSPGRRTPVPAWRARIAGVVRGMTPNRRASPGKTGAPGHSAGRKRARSNMRTTTGTHPLAAGLECLCRRLPGVPPGRPRGRQMRDAFVVAARPRGVVRLGQLTPGMRRRLCRGPDALGLGARRRCRPRRLKFGLDSHRRPRQCQAFCFSILSRIVPCRRLVSTATRNSPSIAQHPTVVQYRGRAGTGMAAAAREAAK